MGYNLEVKNIVKGNWKKRIWQWVVNKPFLAVIIGILTILTVVNLKPDFHLMGWDNYSSYFNLNNGIFRTLFGTWREYRGLGVPTDAESTDLFRMIGYWVLHWFIGETLLDQIFYLSALWLGVLGMYLLASELIKEVNQSKVDFFSGMAALFYLFNLNTLSVFYSPLIPFTNRFFGLPLLLWGLIKVGRNVNKKSIGMFVSIVVLTSGSYITPTVIITNVIALLIFGLCWFGAKKTILWGAVYLLINSFWLLPFVNYSREKSPLVPQARTFVEINESTLNRPSDVFSWEKQATMYPSFFDMSFPSIEGKAMPIHPLLGQYQDGWGRKMLWLFPILYLIGSAVILVKADKYKRWRWVLIWIGLFLFLSTKEFGVGGVIYAWIKNHVPYFAVLFRISDTKFHAYINLAGSLAGALAFLQIISWLDKGKIRKLLKVGLVTVCLVYVWLFRGYLGNLIGFFAYTRLPPAYEKIAQIINKDTGGGRVLHLPMSLDHQYWRSYAWGYLGSAFFDFMIGKPYVDKTFEPASMENAYLDVKVNDLINDYYRNTDLLKKTELLNSWTQLLRRTGVEYVLVDRTISSRIYMRNMVYNTQQFGVRAESIMKDMESVGNAKKVESFEVDYKQLMPYYKKLYPVSVTGFSSQMPGNSLIDLYKVDEVDPMIRFEGEVRKTDINFKNLLETEAEDSQETSRQTSEAGVVKPFLVANHRLEYVDDQKQLIYELGGKNQKYKIEPGIDRRTHLIETLGMRNGNELIVKFIHQYLPVINGKKYERVLGEMNFSLGVLGSGEANWIGEGNINEKGLYKNYRLVINDMVLPVPVINEGETKNIGSLVIEGETIRLGLLEGGKGVEIREGKSGETCYGPRLEGYEGKAVGGGQNWTLNSKKGTVCVNKEVILPETTVDTQYVELEFVAKSETFENNRDLPVTALALEKVGETVKRGYVCIKRMEWGPECLNLHRQIRLFGNKQKYIVPIGNVLPDNIPLTVELGSVPVGNKRQITEIEGLNINRFEKVDEKTLTFETEYDKPEIDGGDKLTIEIPEIISKNSYNHQPEHETMTVPMETCKGGGERTMVNVGSVEFNRMDRCSVYMAQPVVYNPNSSYLFSFDYWLGSGQQPHIVVGRNGDDYLVERASLNQGYPNLEGMGQLLDPQTKVSIGQVTETIGKVKLLPASRLIEPIWRLDGSIREATAHLFQDTDNEGILAVGRFAMSELPTDWSGMELMPEGAVVKYEVPTEVEIKKILPSWWKVKYVGTGGKSLLVLNQGYDRQWTVWGKSAVSGRCNGFNNCFELTTKKGLESISIIYWPEVLSWIGWGITLATIGGSVMWWRKLKKAAEK